jgi:pro-kumamolisin-like protein/Big-like domain-containing protein
MSSNRLISRICVFASVLALGFTPTASFGQTTATLSVPRVLGPVSESQMAPLSNSTLPIARASIDRGRVPDSTPTGHMLMVLKRSEAQQKALDALLAAQKDPKSPSYHKWLTPEQFGAKFGVADADVEAVASYLAGQGFQVGRVFRNKMAIEFSGTTGQVRSAFRTEIHNFALNGRSFNANVSPAQVPAALAPVVKGVTLSNYKAPTQRSAERMVLDRKTGRSRPLFADPVNLSESVSPGDLQVIYDIPAAATGSGVTVGVISDSNINLAIPANYRTLFGLPASTPTVVVDGTDPGVNADSDVTYGTIELLAAVAPQAQVNLYTSADTDLDTGLDFATIRALDDNSVQVLVFPFEGCEANLGPIINLLFDDAWQQAASAGISVIVTAGTGGAAECDAATNGAAPATVATHGLAVNGYASTPYDTAVGASDFFYGPTGSVNPNNPNDPFFTYWSTTNGGADGFTSAKKYIPEQPDNESFQATNQQPVSPAVVVATGGGVSTLGQTASDFVTQGPYLQPAYQAAVASTISTTARVVPDVSFFGANFTNGSTYMLCIDAADCVNGTPDGVQYTAGTNPALAASAFAGVAALVVQAHGAQGNLNDGLYATAAAVPSAFHDITNGTNKVACAGPSPADCGGDSFTTGYNAGPGYDAASGLGSVDVANLLSGWKSTIGTGGATVTLSLTENGTPISSFRHNDPVIGTVTVTGGAGTPTGDVLLTATPVGNPNLPIARVTLTNGQATLPANPGDPTLGGLLPGGSYLVVARYTGDATYSPALASTSVTVTGVPAKLVIVTTGSQGNPLPVYNGQSLPYGTNVHFSFFVSDAIDPNDPASASGNIILTDGGKQVAILPLSSEGFATFSSSTIPAGAHVFNATYSGDSTFSAASLTGPGPSLTIAAVGTTTSLVSTDPNPSVANNTLSLVATVTPVQVCAPLVPCPTGFAPGGKVRFNSVQSGAMGSTVLGTVTLGQGVNTGSSPTNTAVLTLPPNTLKLGQTYSITATYLPNGGGNYQTSTSAPVTMTIGSETGAVGTVTSIATTPSGATNFVNTSSLIFVATVSNTVGHRPTPTGNVTFFSNGTAFPPVTLDAAGIAAFMVPQNADGTLALPLGQSSILAQYDGDATHAPSSTVYRVNVYGEFSTPDFAMQSNTTFQTITAANRNANFTLQFTSMNNLAGLGVPITLSYATPAGITCSGAPASPNFRRTIYATVAVTCRPTAGTRIAQLVTPKNPHGSSRGLWMAESGVALACILLFGLPGERRKWQSLMGSLALLVVAFGFAGCGATVASGPDKPYYDTINQSTNGTANATALAAGNYTVIVTGSAAVYNPTQPNTTVNVVHTIPLRVVVQ